MLSLVIGLLAVVKLNGYDHNFDGRDDDVKKELKKFFPYDDREITVVSSLLLQMKELAHHSAFRGRQFGRDSAVDSQKDVSISVEQPKTMKKLTPYLFEGDILLTSKQAGDLLNAISLGSGKKVARDDGSHINPPLFGRKKRSFSGDADAKWNKLPIKYRFDESMDAYSITQVVSALEFWSSETCVSFENVPNVGENEDCIEFFKGDGCYSMIGHFGGRQGISIGEGCERIGTIAHEIGHVLGLWHEQSRPDADRYIEVLKNYILPTYVSEFLQRDETEIVTLDVPYDLGSIMHYGSTAFSADQKSKTLLTRDPLYQMTIGQRDTPSFYDIKVINEAYCKGKCEKSSKCKNGGYLNPNGCDQCLCPRGFGGPSCTENDSFDESECGGTLKIADEWQTISSPGYPDPGYSPNQKCSWLIETEKTKRVELMFDGDFGIFCSSTCVDFVELKIGDDLSNTGYRICCYDKPEPLVSALNQILIIFHASTGEDVGFSIKLRATTKMPQTTPKLPSTTTVAPRTTIAGRDVWSEWKSWTDCSRPCGACGVRSRTRICDTKHCKGKSQEFAICNLAVCEVDPKCAKLKAKNRLCADSRMCNHKSADAAGCSQPECCPPFYPKKGQCESDHPI